MGNHLNLLGLHNAHMGTLSEFFWAFAVYTFSAQILLRSLVRVALATGRAVAWPDIPCALNVKGALEWPLRVNIGHPPGGLSYMCEHLASYPY